MNEKIIISAVGVAVLGLIAIYQTRVISKLRASGSAAAIFLSEDRKVLENSLRGWLAERKGLFSKLEVIITCFADYRRAVISNDLTVASRIFRTMFKQLEAISTVEMDEVSFIQVERIKMRMHRILDDLQKHL